MNKEKKDDYWSSCPKMKVGYANFLIDAIVGILYTLCTEQTCGMNMQCVYITQSTLGVQMYMYVYCIV